MGKITKMNILIGLFFALLVILFVSPRVIRNLYSSIVGRVILIVIILFFAMNNVTLGLLTVLVIIIASNMFLLEGLDNMEENTNVSKETTTNKKDANKETTGLSSSLSSSSSSSSSSANTGTTSAVDLETIKKAIEPKSSNSLPVSPPATTEEPAPASKEAFRSMYSSV